MGGGGDKGMDRAVGMGPAAATAPPVPPPVLPAAVRPIVEPVGQFRHAPAPGPAHAAAAAIAIAAQPAAAVNASVTVDPEAVIQLAVTQVCDVLPDIEPVYLEGCVFTYMPQHRSDTEAAVLGALVERERPRRLRFNRVVWM